MYKRIFDLTPVLSLMVAMLIVMSAGCAPPATPVPTEAPSPTLVPTEALSPTPVSEELFEVVFGVATDISTLNPIHETYTTDLVISEQINEPLVVLGPDGQMKPWLATSWELVDPTTWRFKLREGVEFTNGEPFNAEVIKFVYDELMNPDNAAAGQPYFTSIVEVKVVDDYTVEFVTDGPNPVLLVRLQALYMMPPEYTKEVGHEGFDKHPIGTGAFKFVEWEKGDHVTLEANPDWWSGAPKVDRITFRTIPEASARVASLLSGECDIVEVIPFDSIPQIEEAEGKSIITRLGAITYVGLDTLHGGPLADRRVRQALNYAVDAEGIVEHILSGYGQVVPATLWPISPGWDPDLPVYNDKEKAKQLLAEAGYPDGFEFDFQFASTIQALVQIKEVVEAIQSELAQVGVTANLIEMESGALFDAYAERKLQAYFFPWRSNPEAATHIQTLIHSQTRGYYYQNSEADKLIDAYMSEMDPEKRYEIGKELNAFLHEDCPWIFMYFQQETLGISDRVKWDINTATYHAQYGLQLSPVE
jgi:peptide/nickel transport system substrate-binding protein